MDGLAIADIGGHEAHHGKGAQGGAIAVLKHLGEMYVLKPFRQLRDGRYSGERRVIFTEASTADGGAVSTKRAPDADVLRYPLFLVELKGTQATIAMELPRRHIWGEIPVPTF